MLVLLRRDFFGPGGVRYRQDNRGTSIPDEVDGRPVVFWSEENQDKADNGEVWLLPVDALPYEPGMTVVQKYPTRLQNAGAVRSVALSELHKVGDVQNAATVAAYTRDEALKGKKALQKASWNHAHRADGPKAPDMPDVLRPSPDLPDAEAQTGEKPPTALPPATKPGSDSAAADAKAGEGQPDPRTPAAEKAGKGLKPEDLKK